MSTFEFQTACSPEWVQRHYHAALGDSGQCTQCDAPEQVVVNHVSTSYMSFTLSLESEGKVSAVQMCSVESEPVMDTLFRRLQTLSNICVHSLHAGWSRAASQAGTCRASGAQEFLSETCMKVAFNFFFRRFRLISSVLMPRFELSARLSRPFNGAALLEH